MARTPKASETATLDIVGEIVMAPVDRIDIGDRLRPVDPVWANALGKIMSAEGQRTPIEICRLPGRTGFQLVTGAHRLSGAKAMGWVQIKAVIVDNDAIDRRLREVSENLWRKGLDPIDRAAFVAELIGLSKAKVGLAAADDGRAVSANVRWSQALKVDAEDASVTMTLAYGWADGVADQVGLSRKTIYRDLELHRGLRPDVVAQLRGHPMAANAGQLRALAKMPEARQREVVEMVLSGAARSATEAVATMSQGAAPDPDKKAWNAFVGAWARMSAAKKREALRHLDKLGLPKGVTLTFDGDAS